MTDLTHGEECYREHHDCAVAEIERLREALQFIENLAVDWRFALSGNVEVIKAMARAALRGEEE